MGRRELKPFFDRKLSDAASEVGFEVFDCNGVTVRIGVSFDVVEKEANHF